MVAAFPLRIAVTAVAWLTCAVLPATSRAAPPPGKNLALHLDLRLPETHPLAAAIGSSPTGMAFPRRMGMAVDAENRLDAGLRASFAGSSPERGAGPSEWARRFHREGLPLARLWENRSALISLGLNPKGKPGLWLVQKTR